jgi:hypothetical protein
LRRNVGNIYFFTHTVISFIKFIHVKEILSLKVEFFKRKLNLWLSIGFFEISKFLFNEMYFCLVLLIPDADCWTSDRWTLVVSNSLMNYNLTVILVLEGSYINNLLHDINRCPENNICVEMSEILIFYTYCHFIHQIYSWKGNCVTVSLEKLRCPDWLLSWPDSV